MLLTQTFHLRFRPAISVTLHPTTRSESDARVARNGSGLNESERFVVVVSSILSISHEALACSLW